MAYVDCYIMPVIAARIDEYRAIALEGAACWKDHGALSVIEALAEDAPLGLVTSFPRSVQLEPGEVVVIGLVTYRDRAHRDDVSAKVMADGRMNRLFEAMPLDGKRMIWGGFETFVTA